MNFITVKNGIITGIHCGDPKNPQFAETNFYAHEIIELPEGSSLPMPMDEVRYYDKNWNCKTDKQLVKEKLIPMAVGYKFNDAGMFEKMNREERVIAGIDMPEAGQKVENGELVPMSKKEQLDKKLITKEEYKIYLLQTAENELNNRLNVYMTVAAQARAEIDEEYAAERKAKISSLFSVTAQKGWPESVEWPE
ncbi:MAG: hypothetical protein LBD20_02675 [Spirochaetaceae bacterium]|jgi:hypothetical protein|nr:hypothetical protein [Spirochaetaceae bacterium]